MNCGIFDGTLTDLWSSLGNVCQEWDVTAVGSHYTISNVGNGMVLDAEDCETANGTVVSGRSSTTPASNGTSNPNQ